MRAARFNIDFWLYLGLILALMGVITLAAWRIQNRQPEGVVPPPPTIRPTLTDTPTLTPTASLTLTLSATPSATPSATVEPTSDVPRVDLINGLHISQFILLDAETAATMRRIYAEGQRIGRNPRAFSKLGDSTIETPMFLGYFDRGNYTLGAYSYLQPVIDYFAGSFERDSVAVRVGLHTWSVMDPMWATGACQSGENMLSCEFHLYNPAFLIIRLGSNDSGVPNTVERSLREIIEFSMAQGVIPILGTKADRFDGAENINNEIIRALAREYHLPLWDYDLVAGTLPGRGLSADNVHMTDFFPQDFTRLEAFQRGHSVHNLSALMTLEIILDVVLERPLPPLMR